MEQIKNVIRNPVSKKIIKSIASLCFTVAVAVFFAPYIWNFTTIDIKNRIIISEILLLGCMVAVFLMITITIWYTVFSIEKVLLSFRKFHSPLDYLFGIVVAGTVAIMYNPLTIRIEMTSFNRQIGHGVIRDYNVEKITSNFFIWILSIIALAFCFTLFINYIRNRVTRENHKAAFKFFDNFTIIAAANLVFRYVAIFQDNSKSQFTFYYSFAIINLLLVATLIYIIFIEKKTDFETFFSLLIVVIGISLPLSALINTPWNNGKLAFGIQSLFAILLIIILSIFKIKNSIKQVIPWIALFAACLPLCLSIYIEGINILHSNSIFLVSLRRWLILIIFIIFVIIGILYFIFKKADKAAKICSSLIFPLLLAGFTALSVQIPLSSTYNADIFETANSSILITDFLNFGKIPIVEHYGGHMMKNVWEGIIYGLLNSDNFGAAFSPYAGYANILCAVGLFYLLRLVVDEKTAFFSVLFLPLVNFTSYWCMGSFAIISIAAYIKKNSYVRAALMWFSFVWCILYRLDLGTSFVIAGIIVLAIYIIENKNLIALKQLGLALAGYAVFFGSLWFSICIIKNIDPISRLVEFIKISASNLTWARNTIGDNGTLIFSISYFFMPISIFALLMYSLFSKSFHNKAKNIRWVLYLLGFAYCSNFQRALVRHSLAEGAQTISHFSWTGYLFIIVFICCFAGRKLFIPVTTSFILLNSLFITDSNYISMAIPDSAISKLSIVNTWQRESIDISTQWEMYKENGIPVQRVVMHDNIAQYIYPLEEITDLLLEDDETFMDFSNRTFAYSALGRECPVYVSQSPLQLSGEYCQEKFISSIEVDFEKIPIAIMPVNQDRCSAYLDGIPNSYRYYKVSEYIYQNYMPLCLAGDNAIWCDSDKYDYYAELLNKNKKNTDIFLIDSFEFKTKEMEIIRQNEKLILTATDKDPRWINFSDNLDLSQMNEEYSMLGISCYSKSAGVIKIYYTTEENEHFSEAKIIKMEVKEGDNVVYLNVPVSDNLAMRLDIEGINYLEINNIFLAKNNHNELIYENYMPEDFHIYNLIDLPRIWAELDDNAVENNVVSLVERNGELYKITNPNDIDKSNGNYIMLTATIEDNTQTSNASLKLGSEQNGVFVPECAFNFNAVSGTHCYIFRVSTDYNWYCNEIDTILIDCKSTLTDITISVLEGD